jgi:hypothetical protein
MSVRKSLEESRCLIDYLPKNKRGYMIFTTHDQKAAAYINKNRITLSNYLLLFSKKKKETIDLLSEEFKDYKRY